MGVCNYPDWGHKMHFKVLGAAAAVVGALSLGMAATPAFAALSVSVDAGACDVGDINPSALLCSGYFDGNLISGSTIDEQVEGLALIGFAWDGNYDEAFKITDLGGADLDFDQLVTGIAYIGVHYGAGGFPDPKPPGATAFYKIDAGTGLDVIDLLRGASSNAYLYSFTPCTDRDCGGGGNEVPEPATWAMMIMGFGGIGTMMRRRRTALVPA